MTHEGRCAIRLRHPAFIRACERRVNSLRGETRGSNGLTLRRHARWARRRELQRDIVLNLSVRDRLNLSGEKARVIVAGYILWEFSTRLFARFLSVRISKCFKLVLYCRFLFKIGNFYLICKKVSLQHFDAISIYIYINASCQYCAIRRAIICKYLSLIVSIQWYIQSFIKQPYDGIIPVIVRVIRKWVISDAKFIRYIISLSGLFHRGRELRSDALSQI